MKHKTMNDGVSHEPDYGFAAVITHLGAYFFTTWNEPDQLAGPFPTKLATLIAARQYQLNHERDPNFVVDLTNASEAELHEYKFLS